MRPWSTAHRIAVRAGKPVFIATAINYQPTKGWDILLSSHVGKALRRVLLEEELEKRKLESAKFSGRSVANLVLFRNSVADAQARSYCQRMTAAQLRPKTSKSWACANATALILQGFFEF